MSGGIFPAAIFFITTSTPRHTECSVTLVHVPDALFR
jgi:hypothetical protein